jgi:hypothetical protein
MKFAFLKPYKKEITKIVQFKSLLNEYRDAENRAQQNISSIVQHNGAASAKLVVLREQINLSIQEIDSILKKCGISATVYYAPPPAFGGIEGQIDLLNNFFNLKRHRIPQSALIDVLDRAIGSYYQLRKRFFQNLINPFFWLNKLIRLPFRLISYSGFDGEKAERSIVGKILKLLMSILSIPASIWAIIQILNYFGCNVRSYFTN